MRLIKFNKTICGVDFLLNVLDFKLDEKPDLSNQVQSADFFQIVFIKHASGSLLLNQEEISLSSNSVIFISQFQNHQWKIENNRFAGKILVFQEGFLNEFFADKYFSYRLLYFYQTQYSLQNKIESTELDEYVLKLIEIRKELDSPKNDSAHLIRSILYNILIRLNRSYANINNINSAIALDNVAYEFRKLVEQHFHTKQRIEDYSSMMGISRVSLNKAVKSQFNVTATDFIKSKLIFEIKMRLIHTNLTISEISSELNFSEPNHLSRLFKNKEGITPAKFRVNYQNGRN